MYYTGKLSADYYLDWGDDPFLSDTFLIVLSVIAAAAILIYAACWFFSKGNKYGWLIAATVFFGLDTLYMIFVIYIYGFSVSDIIDIAFHAWVFYYLIIGITSGVKLRRLPPEAFIEQTAAPDFVPAAPASPAEVPAENPAAAPAETPVETPAENSAETPAENPADNGVEPENKTNDN